MQTNTNTVAHPIPTSTTRSLKSPESGCGVVDAMATVPSLNVSILQVQVRVLSMASIALFGLE